MESDEVLKNNILEPYRTYNDTGLVTIITNCCQTQNTLNSQLLNN